MPSYILEHVFSGTGFPHFMGQTDWQRPETIAGAFQIVGGYTDDIGRVVILSNGEGKEWAVDGPDVAAIRSDRR